MKENWGAKKRSENFNLNFEHRFPKRPLHIFPANHSYFIYPDSTVEEFGYLNGMFCCGEPLIRLNIFTWNFVLME